MRRLLCLNPLAKRPPPADGDAPAPDANSAASSALPLTARPPPRLGPAQRAALRAEAAVREKICWGSRSHFAMPWGTGGGTYQCCFCRCKQRLPLYNYGVYCLKCGQLPLEWIPCEEAEMLTLQMMEKDAGIAEGASELPCQCPSCERVLSAAEFRAHRLPCEALVQSKRKWARLEPRLGLETVTEVEEGEGPVGAAVVRVRAKGMPSQPKRRVEVGDVVVQLSDAPIRRREDVDAALRCCTPGDAVTLQVLRDGEPLAFKVRVGAQISEVEWRLLRSVIDAGGHREVEELERCLQVAVNDKQHWVWGIEPLADGNGQPASPAAQPAALEAASAAPSPWPASEVSPEAEPAPPLRGNPPMGAVAETEEPPATEEPASMALAGNVAAVPPAPRGLNAVEEVHQKLSALKPCLGFSVREDPSTGCVSISEVFPEGLSSDPNQQLLVGDVVVAWDGVPITSAKWFDERLPDLQLGQPTVLELRRGPLGFTATLRVGAQLCEADVEVLMRVAGGSQSPDDVARAHQIRVEDGRQVVWGVCLEDLHRKRQQQAIVTAGDLLGALEPTLGVSLVETMWRNTLTGLTTPACCVEASSHPDSGLLPGDVVLSWNGTALKNSATVTKLLARTLPGAVILLDFIRAARVGTAVVTAGCQLPQCDVEVARGVAEGTLGDAASLERVEALAAEEGPAGEGTEGAAWDVEVRWQDEQPADSFDGAEPDAVRRRRRQPQEADERSASESAAEKLGRLRPRTGLRLDHRPCVRVVEGVPRKGLQVLRIEPEGLPSDFDEQLHAGDVLLTWQGTALDSVDTYLRLMLGCKPGDAVRLDVARGAELGVADLRVGCQVSEAEVLALQRVAQGGTDPREVAESRAVVVHDDDAVVWGMAVHFGAPLVPEAAEAEEAAPETLWVPVDEDTMRAAKEKLQRLKPRLGIDVMQTSCVPPGYSELQQVVRVVLIRAKGLPDSDQERVRLGDILLSWDGEPIDSSQMFGRKLARQRPGDVCRWQVLRDATLFTFEVRVGAQVPEDDAQMLQRVIRGQADARDVRRCQDLVLYEKKHFLWGMEGRPGADYQQVAQDKLTRLQPRLGVEVAEVTLQRPAGPGVGFMVVMCHPQAGGPLQVGDLLESWDGTALTTEHGFWAQFHAMQPGQRLSLGVRRGPARLLVEHRVGAQVAEADVALLEQVAGGVAVGAAAEGVMQLEMGSERHVAWPLALEKEEDGSRTVDIDGR